jgi:hypothetical protein
LKRFSVLSAELSDIAGLIACFVIARTLAA